MTVMDFSLTFVIFGIFKACQIDYRGFFDCENGRISVIFGYFWAKLAFFTDHKSTNFYLIGFKTPKNYKSGLKQILFSLFEAF